MQARICTEIDKQHWNAFVDLCPYADILQRWEWGETKREEGWEPYRLGVFDGGELVLASQCLVKHAKFFGSYMYVPHGPVFYTSQALRRALPAFMDGITKLAASLDAFVLEIEPKIGSAPEPDRVTPSLQHFIDPDVMPIFVGAHFQRISRTMQAKNTLVYDLENSEEELLAQMKKTTRYNVRLAERKEVKITTYLPSDPQLPNKLEQFYKSLQAVNARSGFPIRPFRSFQTFMDQFAGTDQLVLFEASLHGETIAFNISEFLGFWSSSFYAGSFRVHTDTKAAYLMRWEAVKMAKSRGCKVYDFWGIFPNDPSQKGYTDVKLSFGGVPLTYTGLLALPFKPAKYKLWEQARAWRIRAYKLKAMLTHQ